MRRVARSLRILYPGAWYHVMNRGVARAPIFLSDQDRNTFLRLLGDVTKRFRLEVHAYCLMDNHFHLLVRTPEGNLSRAIQHLASVYAQRFNERHDRDGPVFRGRFKAPIIEADAYLLQVSRYIHLNPVEAHLVDRPIEFPWSSYREYVGSRSRRSWWLRTDEVLGRVDSGQPELAYSQLVDGGVDRQTRLFYYAGAPRRPVLGSKRFRKEMAQKARASRAAEDVPDRRRVAPRPSVEEILTTTSIVFRADPSLVVKPHAKAGTNVSLARPVAIELCRELTGVALIEIATVFGLSRASSISAIANRVRRSIERNGTLQRNVEAIRERLKKGSDPNHEQTWR